MQIQNKKADNGIQVKVIQKSCILEFFLKREVRLSFNPFWSM